MAVALASGLCRSLSLEHIGVASLSVWIEIAAVFTNRLTRSPGILARPFSVLGYGGPGLGLGLCLSMDCTLDHVMDA